MRILSTALLFITLSGMIACQKEVNGDIDTLPVNKDTLLKKILVWNSATPKVNVFHFDFAYDGQQRVVKIKRYILDSTTNPVTVVDEDSTVFYYNGSDRKPFKSVGYTRLTFTVDTEVFHRYYSDGRLAADSVGDGSSFIARRYFYYAGYMKAIEEDQFPGFPTAYYVDSFVITNNNFTQVYFDFPPDNGPEIFEDTYDNKINPLHKLNIAYTQIEGEYAYSKFTYLSPGYCPNNIIARSSRPLGTLTHVQTYQFVYNQNGYPVSGKAISNYYTGMDGEMLFTYGH